MTILNKIHNIVLSSVETPEEAIHFLIKIMIEGANNLAAFGPRNKESKVLPMRDRILESRLSSANLFIDRSYNFKEEMIQQYIIIAKKFKTPKSLDVSKLLDKEALRFKDELTHAFNGIRDSALLHIDNLVFVLDNYDISKKQLNLSKKVIKDLEEVSKLTYVKFISELKKVKK